MSPNLPVPNDGVITAETMFESLLAADPSFRDTFVAVLEEYRDEDSPMRYLALADLARHLISQLERGETFRFDAVFDVVERWHIEGDSYVREAATVGLLEDLQNTNLHKGATNPDQFIPWLRPVSLDWWRKVDEFWTNGIPMRED